MTKHDRHDELKALSEAPTPCPDCGADPDAESCPYSSSCPCETCGAAAYCDGAC